MHRYHPVPLFLFSWPVDHSPLHFCVEGSGAEHINTISEHTVNASRKLQTLPASVTQVLTWDCSWQSVGQHVYNDRISQTVTQFCCWLMIKRKTNTPATRHFSTWEGGVWAQDLTTTHLSQCAAKVSQQRGDLLTTLNYSTGSNWSIETGL